MPTVIKEKKQGKDKKPSPAISKFKKNKLNLYLFYGDGVVWDKAKNKALCRFEDGKFLTTDIRIISILVKRKYKYKTKHSVSKELLNKTYSTFKREIKANEKKTTDTLAKIVDKVKKYTRKELNNMRISELKILFKAMKLRLTQEMSKGDMINRLLGARRRA